MHQIRVNGSRPLHVHGWRCCLVLHVDQFHCVSSCVAVSGHHSRHDFAYEHHPVSGQRIAVDVFHVGEGGRYREWGLA